MTPVEKIMSKMNLNTSTDGDSQNINTIGIAPVSSDRQRATQENIQAYENVQGKKPVTSQMSSRKKLDT